MKTILSIMWIIICVCMATVILVNVARAGVDPAPGARKHITWVAYTYPARDGRICHVPAHGRRWCESWRMTERKVRLP